MKSAPPIFFISLIFALLALKPMDTALAQQEPQVDEIVRRANLAAYYAGQDGRCLVLMTITDKLGRTRLREFTILRLNIKDGGEQKFYVFFTKPEDVRQMVYMVWKQIGRDDDRWLYLPALDLVRRIAASDKRSSFVGSNFVYEDISGRGINEDVHELIEENEDTFKIKNTPKDPKSIEFSYYYVWIDKNTYLPVKAEYFNSENVPIKIIEALQIKEIQGIPTVVESRATDLQNQSTTVSSFSQIQYNIGLTEDTFTERYLRRPPDRWISS